jgi:Ca2+-binding EF-hand superfamily protein
MTPVRLFTICATVLAAGAAAAQDSRFARADTDGNGVLSRAEVDRGLPGIAPRFNEVDRNRDGNLSPDELRTWSANKKSADRKSEGGFAEHFRRADANSDGALTRAEVDKALPRLGAKFDRIDANGDGKLTQDELRRYFDSKRTARGKTSAS